MASRYDGLAQITGTLAVSLLIIFAIRPFIPPGTAEAVIARCKVDNMNAFGTDDLSATYVSNCMEGKWFKFDYSCGPPFDNQALRSECYLSMAWTAQFSRWIQSVF